MEQKAHHEKTKDGVKLFCAVYTYAPGGNLFTQAIQETWGKRCDGFLFARWICTPQKKIRNKQKQANFSIWELRGICFFSNKVEFIDAVTVVVVVVVSIIYSFQAVSSEYLFI